MKRGMIGLGHVAVVVARNVLAFALTTVLVWIFFGIHAEETAHYKEGLEAFTPTELVSAYLGSIGIEWKITDSAEYKECERRDQVRKVEGPSEYKPNPGRWGYNPSCAEEAKEKRKQLLTVVSRWAQQQGFLEKNRHWSPKGYAMAFLDVIAYEYGKSGWAAAAIYLQLLTGVALVWGIFAFIDSRYHPKIWWVLTYAAFIISVLITSTLLASVFKWASLFLVASVHIVVLIKTSEFVIEKLSEWIAEHVIGELTRPDPGVKHIPSVAPVMFSDDDIRLLVSVRTSVRNGNVHDADQRVEQLLDRKVPGWHTYA